MHHSVLRQQSRLVKIATFASRLENSLTMRWLVRVQVKVRLLLRDIDFGLWWISRFVFVVCGST
jgi:hypothetical protein